MEQGGREVWKDQVPGDNDRHDALHKGSIIAHAVSFEGSVQGSAFRDLHDKKQVKHRVQKHGEEPNIEDERTQVFFDFPVG